VQGGKIAVCSKSDMVQLLLNHPNMKTLRAETGAHVTAAHNDSVQAYCLLRVVGSNVFISLEDQSRPVTRDTRYVARSVERCALRNFLDPVETRRSIKARPRACI